MAELLDRLTRALADRYRLERELGRGGMATVYLAHDLRHDRKVALKLLKPELAAVIGPERFLSEIRTTANLQHPHILPLFDSGQVDSRGGRDADAQGPSTLSTPSTFLYYVMPYIDGISLRHRMTREKHLPVGEAVRIATEVASALDYAHRHGIVHRDIKPENILLHDGSALVADFGIALAASTAGTRMTETGMSLGTPTYMSPEQAMGERTLDARSDIYALGCVTYEMLVGDPPFLGSTAQAIVAKVMMEKPAPPSRFRETVPPHVEDAVLTALEKLPADRFASAAEFAAALGGGTPARLRSRAPVTAAPAGSNPWRAVSLGLGVLLLGLGVFSASRRDGPPSAAPRVYDAGLPDSAAMTFAATASTVSGTALRNLSISPAGDFVVYAAKIGDSTGLWYRSLRDSTVRPIPGTSGGTAPRVSPDGSRVAFLIGGRVMVVPVQGGQPRLLHEGLNARMLRWIAPATLLLTDQDGFRLSWLDAEGGASRTVTPPTTCRFGDWIPEDEDILCSHGGSATVLDPETGRRWPVRSALPDGSPGRLTVGTAFRLVEGRYLTFLDANGELRAAPYDRGTRLAGRSVRLIGGIRRESIEESQYDIAPSGTIVYAPGADASVGRIVRLAPGAPPEPLPVAAAAFQRFDLSRDRRWLAAVVGTADGHELRIHDLQTGQRTTWLRADLIRQPLWNPAGDRLIVGARHGARWAILAGTPDTGALPDTVHAVDSADALRFDPVDFPSDTLAFVQDWITLTARRFDPSSAPARFEPVAAGVTFPSLSSRGDFVLFSEQSGRIIVTHSRAGARRRQVGSDGSEPLWLAPTQVLFRSGVSWFVSRIEPRTGESVGAPAFWARDPRFSDTPGWSNRPSHDGGIIYFQGPTQVSTPYLRVIPDWVARMKAVVDSANR